MKLKDLNRTTEYIAKIIRCSRKTQESYMLPRLLRDEEKKVQTTDGTFFLKRL